LYCLWLGLIFAESPLWGWFFPKNHAQKAHHSTAFASAAGGRQLFTRAEKSRQTEKTSESITGQEKTGKKKTATGAVFFPV
jgi:hypothetical protein